ncbi:MAG: hypothetical protein RIC56_13740 [Pseudomonadales bacterium]
MNRVEPDRTEAACRGGRRLPSALLLVLALTVQALAAESSQEIYLSVGENGELSFSDVAGPGAQRVVVETAAPLDDPLAELDRRIEQTLSVANALEASRLAREKVRAEARASAAGSGVGSAPEVVYQDRYVTSPYLYPPARPRGRPPHQAGPPPEQPSEEPAPVISRPFPAPD